MTLRRWTALVLLAVGVSYQAAPLAAAFAAPARHAPAGHHAETPPVSRDDAHHHAGCPWDRAGYPCPHGADGGGPSLAACADPGLAQPVAQAPAGAIVTPAAALMQPVSREPAPRNTSDSLPAGRTPAPRTPPPRALSSR